MLRNIFKSELLPLLAPTGALRGASQDVVNQFKFVLGMASSSSETLICLIALCNTDKNTLQGFVGVTLPILEKWLIEANLNNHIELQQKILECVDVLPVTRPLLMEAGSLIKLLKKIRKQKYMRNKSIRKLALEIYNDFEQIFGSKRKIEDDEVEEEDEDYFVYNAKDNDTCRGIVNVFKTQYSFQINMDELLTNNDWCKGLTPTAKLQHNTTIYIPSKGGRDPRINLVNPKPESKIFGSVESVKKRRLSIGEEFDLKPRNSDGNMRPPNKASRPRESEESSKEFLKKTKMSIEGPSTKRLETSLSSSIAKLRQNRLEKASTVKKSVSGRGAFAAALKKTAPKLTINALLPKHKPVLHYRARPNFGRVKLLEPSLETSKFKSNKTVDDGIDEPATPELLNVIKEERNLNKNKTKPQCIKNIQEPTTKRLSVTWASKLENVRFIEPRSSKSQQLDFEMQLEYQKELVGAKALHDGHPLLVHAMVPSMAWRVPYRLGFPNQFNFLLKQGIESEERIIQEQRESENLAIQYFVGDIPNTAREPLSADVMPSRNHSPNVIRLSDSNSTTKILEQDHMNTLGSLIAEAESISSSRLSHRESKEAWTSFQRNPIIETNKLNESTSESCAAWKDNLSSANTVVAIESKTQKTKRQLQPHAIEAPQQFGDSAICTRLQVPHLDDVQFPSSTADGLRIRNSYLPQQPDVQTQPWIRGGGCGQGYSHSSNRGLNRNNSNVDICQRLSNETGL